MGHAWEKEPKIQDAVTEALRGVPSESYGGFAGVMRAIKKYPNSDWNSPERIKENAEGIAEAFRAEAQRRGFVLHAERGPSKEYTFTGLGRTYATIEKLRKPVEAVRMAYWSTTRPPFAKTNEGRVEAEAWFADQEARNFDNAPSIPVTYEVTHMYRRENDTMVSSRLLSDWHTGQIRNMNVRMQVDKAKLDAITRKSQEWQAKFAQVKNESHQVQVHYKQPPLPVLELASNFQRRKVAAIEGQTLGRLKNDIKELCEASGWWSESEAINHVLFGTISARGVASSYDGSSRDITLTISGPATDAEVVEAYREVLERLGRKPLALSVQQEALLRLVAETPNMTFPERSRIWQQKCEEHKGVLKPYKDHGALKSAYYNARKRAVEGWRESDEPFFTSSEITDVPPPSISAGSDQKL